jgi:hypothetical protein
MNERPPDHVHNAENRMICHVVYRELQHVEFRGIGGLIDVNVSMELMTLMYTAVTKLGSEGDGAWLM